MTAPEEQAVDAVRRYNRPASLAAMMLTGAPSTLSILGPPLLINAFVGTGKLTEAQASTLCSAELAAVAVAAFLTALFVGRFDRRFLVAGGLIAILVGHGLTILTLDYTLLLLTRSLAGLGVGTVFATGVAGIAGAAKPDRAFGLGVVLNQIVVILFTAFLARVIIQPDLMDTVLTLAAFAASVGLGIPWIPARSLAALDVGRASPASGPLTRPLLGTAGFLTFSVGIGIIWPQIGQIGLSRGVPASTIGDTIAWASVAALLGGLAAAALGVRLGRLAILIFNMICLALLFLLLQSDFTEAVYRVAVLAILFMFPATLPYLFGSLAALDPAGRFAAISGSMMPSGMSAGGLITAALITSGGFSLLGYYAAAAMILALLLMTAALYRLPNTELH